MSKLLNTDQQIEKLSFLMQLAEGSHDSDLLTKLGAIVIYHGLVECFAIQAARLVEQIILKKQLYEKRQPTFVPHEDTWFYDKQITTRRILKEIRKFLPFEDISTGQKYDKEVRDFLKTANEFLNYRNSLIHRLASPKTDLEGIRHCCDKATQTYQKVIQTQKIMFETLAPYRFSQKEIDFFYGKNLRLKSKD